MSSSVSWQGLPTTTMRTFCEVDMLFLTTDAKESTLSRCGAKIVSPFLCNVVALTVGRCNFSQWLIDPGSHPQPWSTPLIGSCACRWARCLQLQVHTFSGGPPCFSGPKRPPPMTTFSKYGPASGTYKTNYSKGYSRAFRCPVDRTMPVNNLAN